MASVRFKAGKWRVCIRKGRFKHGPIYRTFTKKTVADKVARDIEIAIEEGTYIDESELSSEFLIDLLERFHTQYSTLLAETTQERTFYVIKVLKEDIGHLKLKEVGVDTLLQYFKSRSKVGKRKKMSGAGMQNYIKVLKPFYDYCINHWSLIVTDPVPELVLEMEKLGLFKGKDTSRTLRISDDVYAILRGYRTRNFSLFTEATMLGIETGMRRSEITHMLWSDVNLGKRIYYLPHQKSDYQRQAYAKGRVVPLTFRAVALLRLVRWKLKSRGQFTERVWNFKKPATLSQAMTRFKEKTGVELISFHTARHEFGSTQADSEVDFRIAAAAMGHEDYRSMKRYAHPNMEKVGHKIKGRKK
jgi:integrase